MKQNSTTSNKGAGAAPPARPHGDLPDLRDSHTLAREVAKSIADVANIDAASLAGNGGEGFEKELTMHEREIAESILGTLRNDGRSLRDRLYAVLTGALLAVGPPWPEDSQARRLLGDIDQKMRRIQAALPHDPEGLNGANHMLRHVSDDEAGDLSAAIERFAERFAVLGAA